MTTKSASDTQSYRDRLQALASQLAANVAGLTDEATRPTGIGSAAATGEGDGELARTLLTAEGHTLDDVRAALARLDAGTFGQCEGCGRAIAKARLDAVPYARHCIRCARGAGHENHGAI